MPQSTGPRKHASDTCKSPRTWRSRRNPGCPPLHPRVATDVGKQPDPQDSSCGIRRRKPGPAGLRIASPTLRPAFARISAETACLPTWRGCRLPGIPFPKERLDASTWIHDWAGFGGHHRSWNRQGARRPEDLQVQVHEVQTHPGVRHTGGQEVPQRRHDDGAAKLASTRTACAASATAFFPSRDGALKPGPPGEPVARRDTLFNPRRRLSRRRRHPLRRASPLPRPGPPPAASRSRRPAGRCGPSVSSVRRQLSSRSLPGCF